MPRPKLRATRAGALALAGAAVFAASCTREASAPPAPVPLGVLRVRDDVPPAAPAAAPPAPEESLEQIRYRLLEEQDTDCDQKITKNDQGSRRFRFRVLDQPYELNGSYVLSNLLQELSVAERESSALRMDRVMEDPSSRTSRLIREVYWPALTRRADESGLPRLLEDPKQPPSAERYLYVPENDEEALAYFRRVGRRYDAAYRKLSEGAVGFPFGDLRGVATSEDKRRTLVAMLRTPEGRAALRDVSRRLAALIPALGYPALELQLSRALGNFDELVAQAARPCVQSSTLRLGRIAERSARELGAFSPRQVSVRRLPARETWVDWTASLGARHGALTLALVRDASGVTGVPYVVPGGRFDEMYGWDSYFILLGLLEDGRLDLARGLVDNFVYVIEHYGATLNANRTYYLTRSQPPFFSSMLRAVWDATPSDARDMAWLRRGVAAALAEYRDVWNGPSRRVGSLCRGENGSRACLSRYAGTGKGQPPEVEPGHFDWLYEQLGRSLEHSYASGQLARRDLTAELDRAFRHDRCMRESGHDTTYRWFWSGAPDSSGAGAENRCADMVTVDLNSLLYRYEVDLAYLTAQLEAAHRAVSAPAPRVWCERAKNRMALMKQYLWSARDGLFYDAFLSKDGPVQTGYVSATTLYPLWATALACEPAASAAGAPPPISNEEASALVTSALEKLEAPGGLLATARASRDRFSEQADRQWEYPNGWAPHQMLAWVGLDAHGFHQDAERLTFSWLYTLLTNVVDYNGTIPEKYDVIERTHAVFSEYGNVGTEFDYIATEGFGWMNASFQVGLKRLSDTERARLLSAAERR